MTLFERAQKEIPDLLLFMSEVKAKANRAANPKSTHCLKDEDQDGEEIGKAEKIRENW